MYPVRETINYKNSGLNLDSPLICWWFLIKRVSKQSTLSVPLTLSMSGALDLIRLCTVCDGADAVGYATLLPI